MKNIKTLKKIQKVVKEIKESGITALMAYIGDTEVQQFFMNFAKDKAGNGGENPFANIFGKKDDKDKDNNDNNNNTTVYKEESGLEKTD